MREAFTRHVTERELFSKEDRLLLAFSGGIDSTALAALLLECGYDFAIAHCNFRLRGRESDEDESHCRAFAAHTGKEFYGVSFDTTNIARDRGLGIQETARILRYEWFESFCQLHGFTHILTAHHANDAIETMLINLIRGTGISGITGIRERNGRIVRPLLPFTKEQIASFVMNAGYSYREDSSNADIHYDRNHIRHELIPLMKRINPAVENVQLRNMRHFRQAADVVEEFLSAQAMVICEHTQGATRINRKKLKKHRHAPLLLHYILQPMGFNEVQTDNLWQTMSAETQAGQVFMSSSYRLSVEAEELVITEGLRDRGYYRQVENLESVSGIPGFSVQMTNRFFKPAGTQLIVRRSDLKFPLTVRTWEEGDRLHPFGMKGSKLVSDLFNDAQYGLSRKESTPLLINGNGEIIWVAGLRSDERYRVNENDKDLVVIEYIEG